MNEPFEMKKSNQILLLLRGSGSRWKTVPVFPRKNRAHTSGEGNGASERTKKKNKGEGLSTIGDLPLPQEKKITLIDMRDDGGGDEGGGGVEKRWWLPGKILYRTQRNVKYFRSLEIISSKFSVDVPG